MSWQFQSNPTGNPLPLGRVHATAHRNLNVSVKQIFHRNIEDQV